MDAERKPDTPRHMCHCGKGFLRKEHLRRHQATHGGRSFVCTMCQRSFTRNDLLRRHVALHDSAPSSAPRSWKACDACHENKTKCDGGKQCSLCTKRSIPCTFTRGGGVGPGGTQNASADGADAGHGVTAQIPAQAHSQAQPGAVSVSPPSSTHNVQDVHDIRLVTSTPPSGDEAGPATASQPQLGLQTPVDDRDRTRTGEKRRLHDTSVVMTGLRTVLRVISPAHARVGPNEKQPPAEDVKAWLSSCLKVFFGRFHERWPVIHAPTFDERTDDAHLVGTTVMIGSWFLDPRHIREVIIEIHKCMMSQLFNKLTAHKDDSGKSTPWPLETYQVALLQIAFAFETGRPVIISRASRLLALLVTSMRENGVLNPDAVESHQKQHFPGTFEPFVHAGFHQWNWLALSVVRADAQMSLLCNQPPMLHPEELLLRITECFCQWNGHGIDVFLRRKPLEPADRDQCRMSDMAQSPQTNLLSGTLVEDVQLGLHGMVASVWRLSQLRHSNPLLSTMQSTEFELLCRQLEAWKYRLDEIYNIVHLRQVGDPALNFLLRAYSGAEEPAEAGWEKPVLARIAAQLFSATMAYHFIGLHLFSDLKNITIITTGSRSLSQMGANAQTVMPASWQALERWASSLEARTAVMHSISALKAYENAVSVAMTQEEILDPLAHSVLSASALLLRAWLSTTTGTCVCGRSLGYSVPPLDWSDHIQRDHWVQGGGIVGVDGTPFCPCALDEWMARFATTLSQGATSWDMRDTVMKCINV